MHRGRGDGAVLPTVGPKASTIRRSPPGRSFIIPCGSIQPVAHGCLGHAELFTVTVMDGSGGWGDCHHFPPERPAPRATPRRPPLKGASGRSWSVPCIRWVRGQYCGGLNPTRAGPPEQAPLVRPRRATPQPRTLGSTTSVSTAAMIVYAVGAGITAAAGTRLALQLVLIAGSR